MDFKLPSVSAHTGPIALLDVLAGIVTQDGRLSIEIAIGK